MKLAFTVHLICMHCHKKVGAMSHRLHPLQQILRAPLALSRFSKALKLMHFHSFIDLPVEKSEVVFDCGVH